MLGGRVFRGLVSAAALLMAVIAVGGCGSASGSGAGADPASIAPADSVVYFSVVVRPTGSLKTGVVEAARKITGLSDPFGALIQLADRSTSPTSLNYTRDIAPWLGSRVGMFLVAGASLSHPAYGLIADSTDSSKAAAFIKSGLTHDAKGQSVVSKSYRGMSYESLSSGKEAGGVVNGFAVYGTEAAVREVIDTASGGNPLGAMSAYHSSGVGSASGAVLDGYLSFGAFLRAMAGTSGFGQLAGVPSFAQLATRSIGMTLSATGASIVLDFLSQASATARPQSHSAAQSLASLPGDAWLGFGLGNVGANLSRTLSQLGGASGSPLSAALLSMIDSKLHGLRLERDILPWLGDAGVFLSGSSLATIGGAVVVDSSQPAASKAAVVKIRATLHATRGYSVRPATIAGADAAITFVKRGVPFAFYVVDGGGRFAIAIGARAAEEALHPTSTLAGSADYRTAAAEMGPRLPPSFMLSIPQLAALVLPHVPSAEAAKVRPYLQAFSVLAAGGSRSGSRSTTRLVLGLR